MIGSMILDSSAYNEWHSMTVLANTLELFHASTELMFE